MTQTTDIIDPQTARTLPGLLRERVRRSPQACAYRRFTPEERCCGEVSWEEVLWRDAGRRRFGGKGCSRGTGWR